VGVGGGEEEKGGREGTNYMGRNLYWKGETL